MVLVVVVLVVVRGGGGILIMPNFRQKFDTVRKKIIVYEALNRPRYMQLLHRFGRKSYLSFHLH